MYIREEEEEVYITPVSDGENSADVAQTRSIRDTQHRTVAESIRLKKAEANNTKEAKTADDDSISTLTNSKQTKIVFPA